MNITIEKLHAGYKLTVYPQRSLVLTPQNLREIAAWCQEHKGELEAEPTLEHCPYCGQWHNVGQVEQCPKRPL